MATKKTPKNKKPPEPRGKQVSFSVEPGAKVQITVDVGKKSVKGKLPVTVHVEQVTEEQQQAGGTPQRAPIPAVTAGRLRAGFEAIKSHVGAYDLATWLFIGAVVLYLVTRLVGLTQYPIYFFTDEAFQPEAMDELIAMDYRDVEGTLFPAYFGNGFGLTVYLHWLPLLLFGKSALMTRAVSAIVTVIAAISVGIILRDVFKIRYWWSGVIFLSFTPAWFLHSRTAFETAVFVAFYAGALCAYLLYRYRSPHYLYLVILFASLAFYSYNPAQLMVPVTALVLLVSDWRYHWENRRMAVRGAILLTLLAIPYLRFRFAHPHSASDLLHLLGSYLVSDISLSEKIRQYVSEYFFGLSAWYWYIPNDRDLIRHLMKDYGHIMIATLPFAILGLAYILRHLRDSASRAILLVMLVSPIGGALVQIGITRTLVFVIPAAILAAIGLDQVLRWIENPGESLKESDSGSHPTLRRVIVSMDILLAGAILASMFEQTVDRISVAALAMLLGFHGLGLFERLKQGLLRLRWIPTWRVSYVTMSLAIFAVLSGVNVYLLSDALKNGPLWWREYAEIQYGAFQIYDIIEDYHQEHPEARIIFSSNWANGADVLNRFFLGIPPWLDGGSIEGYMLRKFLVDENVVFIMIPHEYSAAKESSKFTDVRVEKMIPNPDGTPAFYFVRLRYVDNIDEVFAAERAIRQVLQEAPVTIDGQEVIVRYSYLDAAVQSEGIQYVFDNDPFTVIKTFEDNPFVIELTFPSSRELNGFSIMIGSANAQITLKCYPSQDAQPITYMFEGKGSVEEPILSFELPEPVQVKFLYLEMYDPYSPPPSQIHIWELKLR